MESILKWTILRSRSWVKNILWVRRHLSNTPRPPSNRISILVAVILGMHVEMLNLETPRLKYYMPCLY